ncbi:MAG: NUDIX domain-containing protein [Myxococcota bacterium]|jgi:hypothetical protein|nr:NUDIX domain-containing protein [Myxococcota bacterium]
MAETRYTFCRICEATCGLEVDVDVEANRIAAVREAHEEVGLDPSLVDVVGELDDAWSGGRHHLVPVVAWLRDAPALRANPAEVARVMRVPVREVLHPEARNDATVYLGSLACTNTTIDVSEGQIFGLTADLLLEAVEWGLEAR